ncbi:MAG: glycosyltransferase family 39 protein, partial [Thermomicrobiales bacterium]
MAKLRPLRPRPALNTWNIALILVFLAALSLRLYGLSWDDGADLHPDELFVAKIVLIDRIHLDWPPDVAQLLDPARSGLNPRSADPVTGQYREFAYGALPLWVTDFTAWLLSKATGVNWNAAERAFLVGRVISAFLSASTVLIVAALGARLGGRRLGLLAALFAALAPMSIQLAHFFTTDSWLAFFVALCLLACCRATERGTVASFLFAGCTYGLAMATKGSVVALGAPIGAALLLRAMRSDNPAWWRRCLLQAPLAVTAAVGAAAAFFFFEPYALLRPAVYVQSLRTQADIVSGAFDVPFTRVFSGTTTGVYHAEQLARWGLGLVAGVLALGGVLWLISRAWQRVPAALILVSWLFAYSAVISTAEVKFLRYLEPLAPVLAICAAGALLWAVDAVHRRWTPVPATALAAGALLISFGWTAAFMSIYAHENPRVAATNWIYAEVPPGSRVTAEYWDDALPRSLGYGTNPAAAGLGTINFDLYRDLPPPEAANAIADVLGSADYVIQSSQRVEAGVRAEPWRYPVQIAFYDAMARGELDFRPAVSFASQPGLGPIRIDDRRADESFINYDHPFVTIWAKDQPFDRDTFDAAMSWAESRPWQPARWQTSPSLMLDTPVGENPAVNDARWSAAVTGSTVGAIIAWVALLAALLGAGLPWARLLFGAFPDAGWGLARG